MTLVARGDVDGLFQCLGVAWHNGSAIDHNGWAIVASKRHDDTRHILVASWDGNTCIVVLRACDGLNAICNYLTSLEGEAHSCEQSVLRIISLTQGFYLLHPL